MNNSRQRIKEEVEMVVRLIAVSVCALLLTVNSLFGQSPQQPQVMPEWLQGSTVNFGFDGYYLWNFNRPLGRVNLLRAYDVLANSFTISQAGVIVEKPVNLEKDQRWGYRLDLMFGEATATLQAGAQNEPRPQLYVPLFQAFGTYVVDVGKGLKVDFGKWASALGYEGNYSKDQINYSRSYFFNFLPFYHMGFRTSYPLSDKVTVGYMLVNGIQQTEEFNEFKSQFAQLVWTPRSTISWTLNYYVGQEQRDLVPDLNPGLPTIPSQPGLSTTPIVPAPNGRYHAMDTYASIQFKNLTLVGELDDVINRVENNAPPQRVTGGAAYVKYQFTPKVYLAQRYERLNDVAGLFSGVPQNLNELTSTLAIRPADGFEARLEYRRDFSNVPFFFTPIPNELKKFQNTIAFGLLWWFGGKQGSW
jgi:hypothetical protein